MAMPITHTHLTTGDDSLRFIHERPWLRVAVIGDLAGAEKLEQMLEAGVTPDGRRIERWTDDDKRTFAGRVVGGGCYSESWHTRNFRKS